MTLRDLVDTAGRIDEVGQRITNEVPHAGRRESESGFSVICLVMGSTNDVGDEAPHRIITIGPHSTGLDPVSNRCGYQTGCRVRVGAEVDLSDLLRRLPTPSERSEAYAVDVSRAGLRVSAAARERRSKPRRPFARRMVWFPRLIECQTVPRADRAQRSGIDSVPALSSGRPDAPSSNLAEQRGDFLHARPARDAKTQARIPALQRRVYGLARPDRPRFTVASVHP